MRKPKPPAAATLPAPSAPQVELSLASLHQRRRELKAQHDQLVANVNATAGALQLCEQLIAQLEMPAAV